MLAALALALFAAAMPASSRTAWMQPDAFRLVVGMPRGEAVKTLTTSGWTLKDGRDRDELLLDYTPTRTLTLQFRKDRLHSVRFEMFGQLPEMQKAFEEQKSALAKRLGAPKPTKLKNALIYDGTLPNVMVVVSDNGARGLPMLAVRYFDPR